MIKTTYDPGDRRRRFRWELESLAAELARAGLNDQAAPSVTISSGTLADEELARVYRQAHVFVQPSYGEGFGLAPLEAAASGCAVIITGWGAATEVFSRDAALYVPYDLVSAGPFEYDRDSQGLMAKPRVTELARALRTVWQDRQRFDRLRREAQRVAARHSWDRAGNLLRGYLTDLCAQPPRR